MTSTPVLPASDPDAAALPQTAEALLPLVYEELRKLAASRMAQEQAGQTLQPTALVHEVYLKLGGDSRWSGQAHFFGAAAQAMRWILTDVARKKGRVRHGGNWRRETGDAVSLDVAWETPPDCLLEVDEALTKLEQADPMAAQLVSLRFFAGVPNSEAARLLGISESTAKRTWAYARAFLHEAMNS